MNLEFAMPMKMRGDLERVNKNAFVSWRKKLENKTFYLVGWNDSAYAIVDRLGSYNFEYISGHPSTLFERV